MTKKFSTGALLLAIAVTSITTVVAYDWLQQPARAEVGSTDRTTATYADETDDFVIPYDGYLMLDSTPLNGGIELRFELYEFDPGINNIAASPEWTETQTITAYNGRFSVGLGSTTPINQTLLDADQLYLAISIGDGAGGYTPLGGYQAIEPVPYAIWSAHAANLAVAGDANVAGTMTAANVTGTNSIYALNTLSVDGNSRLGNNPFQDFHSIAGELQVEGQVTLGMAGTNSTTVSGPLQVNGNTTLGDAGSDTTTVNGSLTATGNLSSDGSATLGNAISDTHTANGDLTVTDFLAVDGGVRLGNATSDTTTINGNIAADNNSRGTCGWTNWELKTETCNNCGDGSSTGSSTNDYGADITCGSDRFIAGISFVHPNDDNGTHQESYRLYCCEL